MEKVTYLGAFPVVLNWNDSKISLQSLLSFWPLGIELKNKCLLGRRGERWVVQVPSWGRDCISPSLGLVLAGHKVVEAQQYPSRPAGTVGLYGQLLGHSLSCPHPPSLGVRIFPGSSHAH